MLTDQNYRNMYLNYKDSQGLNYQLGQNSF